MLLYLQTLAILVFFAINHDFAWAETPVISCLLDKKVPIVKPSDSTYSSWASPYNLRLQYKPAVIVQAQTAQHISDAVVCASRNGIAVQAKSGGHSYASYSTGGKDGGMTIDLQKFQDVTLDKKTNVATFGAGLRLGNLELALLPFGRSLPHGTCTNVGAGGHFTIGGAGFTSRKYGLAVDSLVGMDVVLANGSRVHASTSENTDVFFAMRGAGPSFGIATTLYAQTFATPTTLTGVYLTWPGKGASASFTLSALKRFQATVTNSSYGVDRNLQFDVTIDCYGGFNLKGEYLGPAATFNATVLPNLLRGLPAPYVSGNKGDDGDDSSYIVEYGWQDALLDANYGGNIAYPKPGGGGFVPTPDHDKFYTKSIVAPALPEKALTDLTAWTAAHQQQGGKLPQGWGWYATLSLLGGYDSQVTNKASGTMAFWRRADTVWVLQNTGFNEDVAKGVYPVPSGIQLVDELNAQITNPLAAGTYGAYLGYVDPSLEREVAGRLYYGEELYGKLKGMKRVLDPGNVFSNPQSVPLQ